MANLLSKQIPNILLKIMAEDGLEHGCLEAEKFSSIV
jgi:hypothetical protein